MTHEEQVKIARKNGIKVTPEHRAWRARMNHRNGEGFGASPYEALHGLWKHGALSVWDRDRVVAAINEIRALIGPGNLCADPRGQCDRTAPAPLCADQPILARFACYPHTLELP